MVPTYGARKGSVMSDHREDIFEASKRYTAGARERVTEEAQEAGEELAYDVEVFWSNHGRRIVEFLLAGGGPTVYVVIDQYDDVTFHHSWGRDVDGSDLSVVGVYGEDAEFWIDQAEDYAEMFHPEPSAA